MPNDFKPRTFKVGCKASISLVSCNARSVRRIVDQMRQPTNEQEEAIYRQVSEAAVLLELANAGLEQLLAKPEVVNA